MYLITASLLNSWKYFLNSGNAEEFKKVLDRVPTPKNESIKKGFAFEKWCEENFEETKGGVYQVKVKKEIEDYLLYGVIDCLKEGVIYDYKFTKNYDVGKFLNNYQTSIYLELVPEAREIKYIITNKEDFNKDNIFTETYKREEKEPILPIIHMFMNWIENNNYSMEKWVI